jgi:hypothetical protein
MPKLALAVLLLLSASSYADEYVWEAKRDREGIQVYTRSVEGSKNKAVKATAKVSATISELVALLMDSSACAEWAALCKESRVVARVSDTELYVYTINDVPWPVADRDAVARVRWLVEPSGTVVMTAELVSGKVDERRKTLRLTTGKTSWTFAPLQDGQVEIISEVYLDPGGATPAWLTNMLLVDAPFDTLKGMKELVASGRYRDSQIPFLTE